MTVPSIGPIKLPNVDIETWLLKFDKLGNCESPIHRQALLERLKNNKKQPVILFSHGWNNEYGHATGWYSTFLQHLQKHLTKNTSINPVFVGIIWPSTWLSFDTGPIIANTGNNQRPLVELQLQEELSKNLPEAERQYLAALLDKEEITEQQSRELAVLLSQALNADSSAFKTDNLDYAPDAEAIKTAMNQLRSINKAREQNGLNGDDLGDAGVVSGENFPYQPQEAGFLGYLDPRWALRVASVYQIKDRAGSVGATGVSALVQDICSYAPSSPLHLVGHSFGAKVVLSALATHEHPKVESVLLLQPAISYLCFEKVLPGDRGAGGYNTVSLRVKQAILSTYSAHDFALHELFHRALLRADDIGEIRIAGEPRSAGSPPNIYAALGGYGPKGASENPTTLPASETSFVPPPGPNVLGLDGTLDRRINGHGDVTTPHTAWLLYCQLLKSHS